MTTPDTGAIEKPIWVGYENSKLWKENWTKIKTQSHWSYRLDTVLAASESFGKTELYILFLKFQT